MRAVLGKRCFCSDASVLLSQDAHAVFSLFGSGEGEPFAASLIEGWGVLRAEARGTVVAG
jgi:hypothetical protein